VTWRFITIRPSHYNEKARWALDRFGHAYVEEPWMPLLHMLGSGRELVWRRGGQADAVSSRFSTPILITEDRTLTDSSAIVGFAASHEAADPSQTLHWSTEVIDLDRHYSGRFGADTRRLAYFYLLPERELLEQLAHRSVGPVQARAWIALLPGIRKALIEKLGVHPDKALRARERIRAEFAAVDERLADGRRYLAGDRFSAADLSFAALGSLSVMVSPAEGYGAWLPSLDEVPSEAAAFARELRATRAGEFILRMFAEERRGSARPSSGS
jgi:glutathione S-transferase